MRFVMGVLLCLGAGGITAALADPATPAATPAEASGTAPATPAAPAAPASATPAAAAQDAKAAAPAQDAKQTVVVQGSPEEDALEKHFLAEGYKIEMHNGEKFFCRREDQLGTRLGGHKVCGTGAQLNFTEQEAKAAVQRGQAQQNNPSGK
ncbi:MAG TPA: hypothetical protein VED45_01500 [Steroidobacteraceae bacterium]|nr:hypothetical protein [Steroidobacteraceae bacterium]